MRNVEKTLYWIRHAQPEYPEGKRVCLGQKVDVPLSKVGMEQAKRLAVTLEQAEIEQVFCSPLLRAWQTAQCIAGTGQPMQILDMLKELDGGAWDGLAFDTIRAQYPDHFVPGASVPPPPGGESDEEGLERALVALHLIEQQTEEQAVVVSHSGISRVLLASLMGYPLSMKKCIHQEYACVSILCCEQGIWKVKEAGIPLEEWEKR